MTIYAMEKYILGTKRPSCRLDWAQSSWTRWIYVAFWWWIKPILNVGNKRTLVDDDLSDLSFGDQCSGLLNKVNISDNKWPGTWRMIISTFGKDSLLISLILVLYAAARIAQPLLLHEIVLYISSKPALPAYVGYSFAIGLGACSTLQAIIHQQVFFRNTRIGVRIRHTLSSLIYKRLLTINMTSLQNTTAAQTINLVANDASKFEELSIFIHYLWEAPLESLLIFGLIWWNIGLPTLFGYTVLFLLVPVQLIFSRKFGQYRKTTMPCTDKRVQTINELINGCQIIKMYNWEKAIEHRVHESRRLEFSSILNSSRLRALNMGISFALLPLISLATFGGSWLMNRHLSAAEVFTTLAFFALLRAPVTIFLPTAIEKLSEARIAAKRIDAFMQLNILSVTREKTNENDKKDYAIVMEDASFSWVNSPSLFNLNFQVARGMLVGVKGAVGAGKSSLLAAILGEINLISGKLRLSFDSIAYAPQSPWIFADTIRANILLGKKLDEERYKNVIQSCCLDTDLCIFGEAGDLMMVGDKGVNLSGGQKARVSLARALYADVDLYLLDDPLSAVDPKVAKKIFDQCFGPRSLLKSKTRILITHQTHFLAEADHTIVLKNGYIDESQTTKLEVNEAYKVTEKIDSFQSTEVSGICQTEVIDLHSIVKNEASLNGAVNWNVWIRLFTSPPLRWFGFLLLIILMLVGEALYNATNRWLSIWSAKVPSIERSSLDAYIYLGLTLGTLVISLVRAVYFYYIILRGSNYFHNSMLTGILYTSLNFFASNPSGRILNRASKDQQVLDELLPFALLDGTQALLATLGALVIIGIINPWVLLILILLVPSFWWLRQFYLRTSRQLKRLESATRSPIFALFSSSLDGLMTIRAFDVKEKFLHSFLERIDANHRAYFTLIAATRWFGLNLDLMTSALTLTTAILSVALRHQMNPAEAALSLAYCINLAAFFQWGVRQSAEAENFMTSAERIYEYGKLVSENDRDNNTNKVLIQPSDEWPVRGTIEFKDYTFRYRPELEPVLKNINLRIESQEKIGVIGRTGAGKSSLLQALFRFVDQSAITGNIYIDGIDIDHVSLNHLRSRLSVIPQVPILFCATLRYNLDPFEKFSNEECLVALEAVQLKHLIRNHPDGLNMLLAESGSNLSAGECQLICVARAILKKSKILLIDEATANVDHATDKMIQDVIADKFRDRTVFTIAHRFNTIANSDRILMLQQGKVAYFDIPDTIDLSQYDKPMITWL
ncbi:unnamed protein product [Rotaria socialis]|uniref:Uncharacterized protein n=1 Tax=Rotaria socialis TaxID=392032 RepID=A0A820NH18_9BILA|nr:unnamed protein product [Rotaria socialis]CAF3482673.1 unnamed protein product [Rotaria socialis]CAF3517302.1 unnamed protein product [Rotaria socialis]CAF4240123.1 unnamed protein product [Rotaria socialis]CAF4253055.1 unnamed protein product [Rotaria socialis]